MAVAKGKRKSYRGDPRPDPLPLGAAFLLEEIMVISYEIENKLYSCDKMVSIQIRAKDPHNICVGTSIEIDPINESIIDAVFSDMKRRFKELYKDKIDKEKSK